LVGGVSSFLAFFPVFCDSIKSAAKCSLGLWGAHKKKLPFCEKPLKKALGQDRRAFAHVSRQDKKLKRSAD
jgi:hypothetical protein